MKESKKEEHEPGNGRENNPLDNSTTNKKDNIVFTTQVAEADQIQLSSPSTQDPK